MEEAESQFQQGMLYYQNEYYGKAQAAFMRAVELDNTKPLFISYLGLAVARAQRKYEEAEALCHRALKMMRTEPQAYLNLAQVYIWAGRKEEAVDTLTMGLQYTKRDVRLVRQLRQLGVRRPPVISFLDRTNFLNKSLGKLRHKMLKLLGEE